MTRRKPDACPRWCEWFLEGPHDGPHIAQVGEVMLSHPDAYIVAVTVESRTEESQLCLTVGGKYTSYASATMTWAECDRLASLLSSALHRYTT